MTENNVSIRNTTKGKLPRLPFLDVKNAILGKGYDLSIAFVGPSESKKLNATYRNKNKPTNVLSFPNSKKGGEIVICMQVARREAPDFGLPITKFVAFLVIHGMLHLKGYAHGGTMESAERKYMKRFGFIA